MRKQIVVDHQPFKMFYVGRSFKKVDDLLKFTLVQVIVKYCIYVGHHK